MKIDVRDNFAEVKRAWARTQKDIGEKAMARALNRTAEQGRTQMVRGIAREFAIQQSEIRAQVTVSRARPGAGGAFLTVDLKALQNKRGRGFNLIRFLEKRTSLAQAKQRRKAGTLDQLHFQIKRSGGRKLITNAFIGNKGRTVFMREGKERLPIKAVTTIDVAQMFNTRRINDAVVRHMLDKFPAVLKREIEFYTKRIGA
jgi:hypothetical protein